MDIVSRCFHIRALGKVKYYFAVSTLGTVNHCFDIRTN